MQLWRRPEWCASIPPNELLDAAEAFSKCKPAHSRAHSRPYRTAAGTALWRRTSARPTAWAPVLSRPRRKSCVPYSQHCPIKNPVDLAGTPEGDMWCSIAVSRCFLMIRMWTDRHCRSVRRVCRFVGRIPRAGNGCGQEHGRAHPEGRQARCHAPIYQPQQPDCLKYLSEQGVPVFGAVDEAVRTMGVLCGIQRAPRRPSGRGRFRAARVARRTPGKGRSHLCPRAFGRPCQSGGNRSA